MVASTADTAVDADIVSAILTSAQAVFEADGMRRANVDNVATSAGVSRSTLYRRFPSKTSLLLGVAEKVLGDMTRELDHSTRGFPPQAAVVEAFCTTARLAHEVPFFSAVLRLNEAGKLFSVLRSVREEAMTVFAGRVATTLRRAGATMPDDALTEASHLLVRIAWSMNEIPIPGVAIDDERAVRRFATIHLAQLVH
ncbi:putative TetR family transcriptional regulator [Gordonia effusa NBRC 100432]|uniref:Putative TetR family transcriptional regulator n=1 Tax=Gordonia effusa NBRC 100432 TaxID=1077974 RepID=H0QWF1_9ACTN|nr:putative TetR family transcriptional regulator [Gordonia effusa NBRC 100432]